MKPEFKGKTPEEYVETFKGSDEHRAALKKQLEDAAKDLERKSGQAQTSESRSYFGRQAVRFRKLADKLYANR